MSTTAIKPPITPPLVETIVQLAQVKPIEPPKTVQPTQAAKPVSTQQFLVPVVTAAATTTIPTLVDNVAIGTENITVAGGEGITNVPVDAGPVAVGPAAPVIDNNIHNTADLDVMPEPVGGAAAWNKFLQKNMRYPDEAIEQNISGKVWVSFVVEKDGQLSNITVDRGIGYGTEKEAIRVLKQAKAWKPGKQNGQPVRVKYNLPLTFVLNQ